jgi:hypothetical protein
MAAIVGQGAAVVVDRRMQRLDRTDEARSARAAVLLPLSLKLPPGSTGGVLALLAAEHAVVRFWGRQDEQDRLDAWLSDPKSHPELLVTGPVWVGKTRLR